MPHSRSGLTEGAGQAPTGTDHAGGEDEVVHRFPPVPYATAPELFANLREHRPVRPVRMPSGHRVHMLTRRDDIRAALTDPRFSRNLTQENAPRITGDDFTHIPGALFELDPPDHTRVHRVLTPLYTCAAIERRRPAIRHHAHRLLDTLRTGPNPADLASAYAVPLPALVSAEVLRIPAHLRAPYTAMFRARTDHTAAPADITDAATTILGLAHQVIADKETAPDPGDPIGARITARDNGALTDTELVGTTVLLLTSTDSRGSVRLAGGCGTTTTWARATPAGMSWSAVCPVRRPHVVRGAQP